MRDEAFRLFFKAVSNNTRMAILRLLAQGNSKSVGDIFQALGFKQSRVSRNLRCLENCGFVTVKRVGKQRVYSLNQETIAPILSKIDEHITIYKIHLRKCGVLQ